MRDEEISQNSRLLLEGSTVIFQTIKSIITSQTVQNAELVEGLSQAGGLDENLV